MLTGGGDLQTLPSFHPAKAQSGMQRKPGLILKDQRAHPSSRSGVLLNARRNG